VNNAKLFAFIDSGADTSALSMKACRAMNIDQFIQEPKPNETQHLDTFDQTTAIKRIGTVDAVLAFGETSLRTWKFEVCDCEDDMIIGTDLFQQLGLYIGGLPFSWPGDKRGVHAFNQAAEAEEELRKRPAPWGLEDRINPTELATLNKLIADELSNNDKLDPTTPACSTFEEANMALPLNVTASYRHQYTVPAAAEQAVHNQVMDWLDKGVTERGAASSNFNSPLLAVGKKDLAGNKTKWRVCIDFRHINKHITETFSHARERMPHLHEALAATQGFTHASSLDLEASYHQFGVNPEDRDKTTFTYKKKKYRFARWPFGLNPASPRFQKVMEMVLEGLEHAVVIWMDDILVFSDGTVEQHAELVNQVLKRLNKHNLKVNRQKCHFGFRRVLMLGHMLSGTTRELDPLKIATAAKWADLTTGKSVQRFLGFTNFLRDYIPLYSKITAHLEPLKKRKRFNLSTLPLAKEAFETIKKALGSAPVLSHPDRNLPLIVATDASREGVGAVLYQEQANGKRKYIAFASTSLKGAQKNYGATKRELLGIVFALRAFHNHVFGRHFVLFTDHQALTALFTVNQTSCHTSSKTGSTSCCNIPSSQNTGQEPSLSCRTHSPGCTQTWRSKQQKTENKNELPPYRTTSARRKQHSNPNAKELRNVNNSNPTTRNRARQRNQSTRQANGSCRSPSNFMSCQRTQTANLRNLSTKDTSKFYRQRTNGNRCCATYTPRVFTQGQKPCSKQHGDMAGIGQP
jgi:hypothetical protein